MKDFQVHQLAAAKRVRMPPRKVPPVITSYASVHPLAQEIVQAETGNDWNRVWITSPMSVTIYNSYEAKMRAQLRASEPKRGRNTRAKGRK
jgi:hypothetical protein